jgi:hypothetical protein
MKRSEMIDLMNECHIDYFGEMAPLFCDRLLAELERAGMLPPFVDHFQLPQDAIDEDRDWYTLHVSQAAYSGLCEWEKE